MNQHEQVVKGVIGVKQVCDKYMQRYRIVDPVSVDGKLIEVNKFLEKPAPGNTPSKYAIMDRYVLPSKIFKFLGEHQLGAGEEIQLTDAIQKLNENKSVHAYELIGRRFDVGDT